MGIRRHISARAGALALASVLALAGCGSDDKDGLTEDQFCVERARRECEKIGVVCGRNLTQCQQVRTDDCRKDATGDKQGGRAFRADSAEGCLAAVSATYDNKLIRAEHWRGLHDACARVFEGRAMANQPCALDEDCAAPLVCDKRLCGLSKQVGSGGGCANPGEICLADEYCRPGAGFATCTKRLDRGAACGGTELCQAQLRCRQAACTNRLPEGSVCESDEDCLSGYCNVYSRAGSPHTCTMGLSFGTDSPSCEAYFGAGALPDAAAVADAASPDVASGVDAGADAGVAADASSDSGTSD